MDEASAPQRAVPFINHIKNHLLDPKLIREVSERSLMQVATLRIWEPIISQLLDINHDTRGPQSSAFRQIISGLSYDIDMLIDIGQSGAKLNVISANALLTNNGNSLIRSEHAPLGLEDLSTTAQEIAEKTKQYESVLEHHSIFSDAKTFGSTSSKSLRSIK